MSACLQQNFEWRKKTRSPARSHVFTFVLAASRVPGANRAASRRQSSCVSHKLSCHSLVTWPLTRLPICLHNDVQVALLAAVCMPPWLAPCPWP